MKKWPCLFHVPSKWTNVIYWERQRSISVTAFFLRRRKQILEILKLWLLLILKKNKKKTLKDIYVFLYTIFIETSTIPAIGWLSSKIVISWVFWNSQEQLSRMTCITVDLGEVCHISPMITGDNRFDCSQNIYAITVCITSSSTPTCVLYYCYSGHWYGQMCTTKYRRYFSSQ